ncbi:hypothetical protein GALMADRAFT_1162886 [Galerina marginata CBS 339.88]|uniref:Uncharacterized protein n=1 Tax=Galerina marginata (strain CBS 339.88) TaxID=685588 RepID=A0A067T947_GALM3|nr:hypothetical protein GALMADRAFT_1162886 [Galerina marginata CBS 339.88]
MVTETHKPRAKQGMYSPSSGTLTHHLHCLRLGVAFCFCLGPIIAVICQASNLNRQRVNASYIDLDFLFWNSLPCILLRCQIWQYIPVFIC